MKAAVLERIGKLDIKDIKAPECTPGTVLMKIEACAVCATDVKCYRHGHRLIRPPRVTGHELAGTVVEVGKGVDGIKKGDNVAVAPAVPCGRCAMCIRGTQNMCLNLTAIGYHYDGGFAEYMVVPEIAVLNECVNKMPEGV